MRLTITSTFPYPAERIWAEVQTTRLMLTVIKPLVQFQPLAPPVLPATWEVGEYVGRMALLGLIPFGQHTIRISFPAPQHEGEYQVRDNGSGQVIARWDHLITVRKLDDAHTRYQDDVAVEAGLLTPFVWLYAHLYYRYRHWRWQQLIRADFDYRRF
jgi:hypothetical protein